MGIKLTSEIKVESIQSMGGDHMVVAAAKVSTNGAEAHKFARVSCEIHTVFDPEWRTCDRCKPWREKMEESRGLIRYLMRMRHGTPFESSAMTFFVQAPIFVWREWHRHRVGFSYNEESGRYKQLDPVFYIPPSDRPMIKVGDWKPGRPKFLTLDEYAATGAKCSRCQGRGEIRDVAAEVNDRCHVCNGSGLYTTKGEYDNIVNDFALGYELEYQRYERQLARNLDPGLARDCLPVGIYSSCWVTANPRSLMHFLSLRTHHEDAKFVSYPLYEIEVAANAVEALFAQGWPITHAAFVECGRVAP